MAKKFGKSAKKKNTGTTDALRKIREYEYERDVLGKNTKRESAGKPEGNNK